MPTVVVHQYNMELVDNNQFEVKPTNSKRKISGSCPNVYLNPALDILANDDPICNTAMEIIPNKKKKHTNSCEIAAFENTALDLGISRSAVNEFLARELNNVYKNLKVDSIVESSNENSTLEINNELLDSNKIDKTKTNIIEEPIYANVVNTEKQDDHKDADSITETVETKSIFAPDISEITSNISSLKYKSTHTKIDQCNNENITNIETNVTNQIFIAKPNNLNLSFIDRLALDSPNTSNQSLYLDDDLNESNIMEIKTITIITKKKRIQKKNTNPFLDTNIPLQIENTETRNPFLNQTNEIEYSQEVLQRPVEIQAPIFNNNIIPRKLFSGDTNSTISTVNESSINIESQNEYENIDSYRSESPIYENIAETDEVIYNKQSKILGCDVSQFNAVDILNLNKNNHSTTSNETSELKKDLKHQLLKVNKLSKKVFKTLKKTFKSDKADNNVSLNPYEVPRKPPKQKTVNKDSGIANPALNLDNSDEIEIKEICEDENEYETLKTIRNTRLNMNVTPLKEKSNETDLSISRTNTPGKKVRFDSTLNQEKVITGNSFDCDVTSPGFNSKIEKYHDELENCINERKFLEQNM